MGGLFYPDVLSALSAAGVPHVVVGGIAMNLQDQDASDVDALRRVKEASGGR